MSDDFSTILFIIIFHSSCLIIQFCSVHLLHLCFKFYMQSIIHKRKLNSYKSHRTFKIIIFFGKKLEICNFLCLMILFDIIFLSRNLINLTHVNITKILIKSFEHASLH